MEFEAEAVVEAVGWIAGVEFGFAEEVTSGTVGAAEEFCVVSCDTGVTGFLLRKRVAAPKSVPTITTIMAAIFQLPVGLLGATDQSGWVKTGATGKVGAKGADCVGAAASRSHGFFEPREMSGKGPTDGDLPLGKLGFGGGTTGDTNAGGDARFGALLFNFTGETVARFDSGAERGFCDWSSTGAGATGAGLVDEGAGIIAGTGAGVFSLAGGDALVGAVGGTFTAKGACDGADDRLFADGGAG